MEYPPPLCFATQNIGEVTRSGGEVENDISSICSYQIFTPPSPYGHSPYIPSGTPRNATGHGKGRG